MEWDEAKRELQAASKIQHTAAEFWGAAMSLTKLCPGTGMPPGVGVMRTGSTYFSCPHLLNASLQLSSAFSLKGKSWCDGSNAACPIFYDISRSSRKRRMSHSSIFQEISHTGHPENLLGCWCRKSGVSLTHRVLQAREDTGRGLEKLYSCVVQQFSDTAPPPAPIGRWSSGAPHASKKGPRVILQILSSHLRLTLEHRWIEVIWIQAQPWGH